PRAATGSEGEGAGESAHEGAKGGAPGRPGRVFRHWTPRCLCVRTAVRARSARTIPTGFEQEGNMGVQERVKSIIVEQLGVDEEEVTLEASFTDDLGADSLDIVELVMAFEEEFGIEIPDEEAEKISNVREAVDYIQNNAGDQN